MEKEKIRGIMILGGIFWYQTYDLGSIVQGMDEEDLERLLQLHLQIVSVFLMFSLIYAWSISF
jgi:hypothetical protein